MTVIAVRNKKDSIEIAADQQASYGKSHKIASNDNIYKDGNKIFEENGMVIGACGDVSEYTFMRIFSRNHKPKTATEDSILDYMVEFSEWGLKKNDNFVLTNWYILIFEGKVFEIIQGYDVKEIINFSAIGSGMFLALGALYYNKSVEESVEVAKEYDLYCGGKTQKIIIKK